MSPSRTSTSATLFAVLVATVGAMAIQAYEVKQATAPVVVQLERVEIVAQRDAVTTLAQVGSYR